MEKNKVIRRQPGMTVNGYEKISEDFTELFAGFNGVTVETIAANSETSTAAQTRIYFDRNKTKYIRVIQDDTAIVRISLHCGNGTRENYDWLYIDKRSSSNDKLAYNFAKTDYGVVFSVLEYVPDDRASLSDGYLQNYFTTFETNEGRTVNGFIYCVVSKDDNSNSNLMSYILTEEHENFEKVDFTKLLWGYNSNQTVLANATSYTWPLVCNHLYKKIQTEEGKFGKITLNDKTFISGSHFCLECKEEEE